MTDAVRRAHVLIQQRRWEMAENELRLGLAQDGQNPELHGLLALCLVQREKFAEAEAEARLAVGLAPDDASSFRTLAVVLAERRRYADAAEAVAKAIELDPFDVESFGLLARLRFVRNDWKGTLEAANLGLSVDPEHVDCNNWRALALVKLGRRNEAGQTIGAALARDPEDAFSHANQGWTLLESGDREQALIHFREALRIEPQMVWARMGIIEALKSKNIVYRLLLKYFLFMSRLSPRTRWGVVIGGYVLQRLLAGVAESNPTLAPFCMPFLIAYLAFALLTWLGYPLFNLLLFTDKFGRLTLSRDQKLGAGAIGGLLLLSALIEAAAVYLMRARGDDLARLIEWSALNCALISMPVSAVFHCSVGWPRRTMVAATSLLAIVGFLPLMAYAYVAAFPNGSPTLPLAAIRLADGVFVYGILGLQFLAMKLTSAVPER